MTRIRTIRNIRADRWLALWLAIMAGFWGCLWWVLK